MRLIPLTQLMRAVEDLNSLGAIGICFHPVILLVSVTLGPSGIGVRGQHRWIEAHSANSTDMRDVEVGTFPRLQRFSQNSSSRA